MRLKILQFGRTGQVAMELLASGALAGHQIVALGRNEVDLEDPATVAEALAGAPPVDVVINGAAYTAVDKAESEPERARAVNTLSVGALAEECAARGLPLIQISTDYVFDGTKHGPYTEDDPVCPISVYGASKEEGESLVRSGTPSHVIMRTSWVYSAYGTNFVKTMLHLGAQRDELRIVDDQWGAPTAAGEIAKACLKIAERLKADGPDAPFGTYHFTSSGETTWRRFAEEIFARSAAWSGVKAKVIPIPSTEYPTPARRPANSRLDCAKIERAFDIVRRPWQEGLSDVLSDIRVNREKSAQ